MKRKDKFDIANTFLPEFEGVGAIFSDYSLRKELMKADGAIKSITLSKYREQTLEIFKTSCSTRALGNSKVASECRRR
jgi:hypothetical protein